MTATPPAGDGPPDTSVAPVSPIAAWATLAMAATAAAGALFGAVA